MTNSTHSYLRPATSTNRCSAPTAPPSVQRPSQSPRPHQYARAWRIRRNKMPRALRNSMRVSNRFRKHVFTHECALNGVIVMQIKKMSTQFGCQLTVPAVSRISSIHWAPSTSTCCMVNGILFIHIKHY